MRPAVILGYHGIADVVPRYDPIRLFVPPDSFERQVRTMQRRGYEFLTCSDFAERLKEGRDMRAKCTLTFDDGSSDVHTYLAPALARLGVRGTVYCCPGLLGEPYPWCDDAAGQRFMSRAELLEVAAGGVIEIGAHTNEHTHLDDASADQAFDEMDRCKGTLEDMIQRPVLSFCYPGCGYSAACPDAARRAGFTNAVTCGQRGSWNPFELRRESLHTPDGPFTFALKSRSLYYRTRDLPPARLARAATRSFRHRRERV